jgi:hypothetical protein
MKNKGTKILIALILGGALGAYLGSVVAGWANEDSQMGLLIGAVIGAILGLAALGIPKPTGEPKDLFPQ